MDLFNRNSWKKAARKQISGKDDRPINLWMIGGILIIIVVIKVLFFP